MPTNAQLPPPDLTPWHMFESANAVVKGVIIALLCASVITWTIMLAKSLEVAIAQRRLRVATRALGGAGSMGSLGAPIGAHILLKAAEDECAQSAGLPVEGVKDRIAMRLQRVETALARHLARGTGVLASIGSCAPFVGLFGTVWGIMDSFVGISRMQTTNLAVVAPGISEALLATACGLAAAIPAVVFYNMLARMTANYRLLLGDASAFVLALASRDLDRLGTNPGVAKLRAAE